MEETIEQYKPIFSHPWTKEQAEDAGISWKEEEAMISDALESGNLILEAGFDVDGRIFEFSLVTPRRNLVCCLLTGKEYNVCETEPRLPRKVPMP